MQNIHLDCFLCTALPGLQKNIRSQSLVKKADSDFFRKGQGHGFWVNFIPISTKKRKKKKERRAAGTLRLISCFYIMLCVIE